MHSFTNALHMFISHSQIIDTFSPLHVNLISFAAYSLV